MKMYILKKGIGVIIGDGIIFDGKCSSPLNRHDMAVPMNNYTNKLYEEYQESGCPNQRYQIMEIMKAPSH